MQGLPLKGRIFKSRLDSRGVHSHPLNVFLRDGPGKQWINEDMTKAIAAVEREGFTIRRAAKMYQIPRLTLHDHLTGKWNMELYPD